MRIPLSRLESFARDLLVAASATEAHARVAARVRSATDSLGVFTHGTKRLRDHDVHAIEPDFAQRIEALREELRATPVVDDHPGILLPGDLEWRHRARALSEGVEDPPDVLTTLERTAEEGGRSESFRGLLGSEA